MRHPSLQQHPALCNFNREDLHSACTVRDMRRARGLLSRPTVWQLGKALWLQPPQKKQNQLWIVCCAILHSGRPVRQCDSRKVCGALPSCSRAGSLSHCSAGRQIVVEEFLEGEEVSFFALIDGSTCVALTSAQDHKAVGDGDTGPNTGGMGAYSPAPVLTSDLHAQVRWSHICSTWPTHNGLSWIV